jgi:type IV fimbrial biogenesis protein FimT
MNNKGFTLTELTVTLAILGIVSAISIPNYFSWLPRYRLQTSVRCIYDDMNKARSIAIRNGTDVGIEFNTSNENYRIFTDTDKDQVLDAGETVLITGTLEDKVNILESTFTNNTYGVNDRGMAAGSTGDVRLTNSSGLFMGVRAVTSGNLTIISSTDGGSTWG